MSSVDTMPEWVDATIRYIVAMMGFAVAALDLMPASVWDQVAPAIVGLGAAAWGVWRTRQMQAERDGLEMLLVSAQATLDSRA